MIVLWWSSVFPGSGKRWWIKLIIITIGRLSAVNEVLKVVVKVVKVKRRWISKH